MLISVGFVLVSTLLGFLSHSVQSMAMSSILESGSVEFALKLDKILHSDKQNVVFSAFSLSTALAMTLMGSKSTCAQQLSQVLFGKTIKVEEYDSVAKEYRILVDKCVKSNENVMTSANFMYSDTNYPILSLYKQTIESSFGAKSQELDFANDNQKAIEVINEDISRATNGKIAKLFDQIDSNTKLILANALYFKGLWKSKFNTSMTSNRKFTTNDKKQIDVQMMSQNTKIPFVKSDELKCSAIELGYDNSNTVLIVLLPEESSSVSEVKSKLNGQTFNQLLKSMVALKVDLFLPKFKVESTLPLVPVLAKMGIKEIFDSKVANFSGITSDPIGLYVSDVIQKAVIEVNEEGTEAAAATGISFMARSMVFPQPFEANRPFIFYLLSKFDSDKHLILFSGTVNNPNK